MEKNWYNSKTLWINLIALVAFIAQKIWGFVIDPILQADVLIVINIILRVITKEEIVWGRKANK